MDKTSESPKKRDRTNENFARARDNIIGRCNKISRQYGADIYLLIRRKQYHDEYSSLDAPSWPPSKVELENVYPLPRRRTPANFYQRRPDAELRSSPDIAVSGQAAKDSLSLDNGKAATNVSD